MPEGIIVIADRDAMSPHSRHADAFIRSCGEGGCRLPCLESEFPAPGPDATPEGGYRDRGDGMVAPFPAGSMLLVVADPAYWFDLSRAQKRCLDGFYHYMVAAGDAGGKVTGSAVLFCGRDCEDNDTGVIDKIVSLHQSFCGRNGIVDRGILRTACISTLP